MKKVDYIIVGFGIAGLSICERLREANKKFVVFDINQPATKVAGGVINPCVLKHYTAVWQANKFISEAIPFYKELEKFLEIQFLSKIPIKKVFNSVEDQNLWSVASDKKELSEFLNHKIQKNEIKEINAPFGLGTVNESFKIDTEIILKKYQEFLNQNGSIINEKFNFNALKVNHNSIVYNSFVSDKIVFAEGFLAINNPLFPKHILIPKKGEYITIEAEQLDIQFILKSKFFVIPLGNNKYKVGATFAHNDYENNITSKGKSELTEALNKLLNVPFKIINQEVGMRPTVKDRRPLLGSFDVNKNVYFFNGLGTRGLLMAPLLSKSLFSYMNQGVKLPSEIDIKRFTF